VIDKTAGVKWHNGGQLQFGPDGHLYFAMGDSARNPYDELPDPPATPDPDNNSQNPELVFGKLFRIDVDDPSPTPEVVAVGLRNTWRFSFDRENGDLYLADVGQFAWDELDYVPAGTRELLNFGWSLFEANAFHNRDFELSLGRLTWPILRIRHGPGLYCSERGSITGGYVYRGDDVPQLAGRYVFGDYCSGEVWTVRVVNGRAADLRKEPVEVPSLVSFAEDADGELYAISLLGAIHRLVGAA
jgi:glucose/arabinose dehydrogenase